MLLTFVMISQLVIGSFHQILYRLSLETFNFEPLALLYAQSIISFMMIQGVVLAGWKKQPNIQNFYKKDVILLSMRGILAVLGHFCLIQGIAVAPLLTTILSSCAGIITAVVSMLILEKEISSSRIIALLIALIGMIFSQFALLRIFFERLFLPVPLHFSIGATLCFSISSLMTKSLTRTYSAFEIVYCLLFTMSILTAILLIVFDWRALIFYANAQWILMSFVLACTYTALHGSIIYSYIFSDLSWIVLFKNLKLPILLLFHRLFFYYTPTYAEYLGAICVVVAIFVHDVQNHIQKFLQMIRLLTAHTKALS